MNKKQEALRLRKKGWSYGMIQESVPVSKATLSQWLSGIEYQPSQEAINRARLGPIRSGEMRRRQKQRERVYVHKKSIKEIGKLTERDTFMLGLGLYIGEGSKSLESVRMINSDPTVIMLSVKWFKLIADVSPRDLMIEIHGYPDMNLIEAKKYWSELTGVPLENFTKIQIDERKDKRLAADRKLRYGTIQLRVKANGDRKKESSYTGESKAGLWASLIRYSII